MENRLSRALETVQQDLDSYRQIWSETTVQISHVRSNEAVTEYHARILLDEQVVETATVTLTRTITGWEDMVFILIDKAPADHAAPLSRFSEPIQPSYLHFFLRQIQEMRQRELIWRLRQAFREKGIEFQRVNCRENGHSSTHSMSFGSEPPRQQPR